MPRPKNSTRLKVLAANLKSLTWEEMNELCEVVDKELGTTEFPLSDFARALNRWAEKYQ
jgi:hypothetical protein